MFCKTLPIQRENKFGFKIRPDIRKQKINKKKEAMLKSGIQRLFRKKICLLNVSHLNAPPSRKRRAPFLYLSVRGLLFCPLALINL